MSSDRDINSKLDDVAKALTDIVSRLQAAIGTTSSEHQWLEIPVHRVVQPCHLCPGSKRRLNAFRLIVAKREEKVCS